MRFLISAYRSSIVGSKKGIVCEKLRCFDMTVFCSAAGISCYIAAD
jgi:hypothetical protein